MRIIIDLEKIQEKTDSDKKSVINSKIYLEVFEKLISENHFGGCTNNLEKTQVPSPWKPSKIQYRDEQYFNHRAFINTEDYIKLHKYTRDKKEYQANEKKIEEYKKQFENHEHSQKIRILTLLLVPKSNSNNTKITYEIKDTGGFERAIAANERNITKLPVELRLKNTMMNKLN